MKQYGKLIFYTDSNRSFENENNPTLFSTINQKSVHNRQPIYINDKETIQFKKYIKRQIQVRK